ncbi:MULTISPECIES: AI-2E family transporter [unclassified Diaminobutyricimonas]|uniref:AI-2E family transporter n=1 Tax=unclassified Diaminobutyricimonas TaxID=2643261 RepID=UPI0012F516E1|nr:MULTISPECIES: AI-2E family transporter [unclassified Diaminobutyricimonas]
MAWGKRTDTRSTADRVQDSMPVGIQIAGGWSWRLLAIAGVVGVFIWLIIQLRYLVIPLMIAVLLSALLVPFSNWLQRHRWPKWLAVTVAEVGIIAVVTGLVWLVINQIARGVPALQEKALERFEDLKDWLLTSPLELSEADINTYIADAWENLQRDGQFFLSGAASIGATAGHFVTGLLLTLFATLFILIDGRGIWNWTVRLFPRRARPAVQGGGEAGWITLTNFVKVQIFVAFVDAVGIGLGAVILQLPLAIPIAVAVFLGSFVPIIGAVVTGAIAVLVALITYDIWIALIMLGIVLLVQQIEGHVLQPLVMGTAVKVHPLAVVLAVAGGSMIAGIPGALFAVPVVATLNSMVKYIASGHWRTTPHPTLKDVTRDA